MSRKLRELPGDGPLQTNASLNRAHAVRMFEAGMTPAEIAAEFPVVFTCQDGQLGQKYDSVYRGSQRKETRFLVASAAVDAAIEQSAARRKGGTR